MKIYHPDVFKGDKEFAKERLSQLNAAHEFLSDEQQKQDFDKSPQSQEKAEAEQDFDPEQNSNEFDEGIKILSEEECMKNLLRLYIEENETTEEGLELLADPEHLEQLEYPEFEREDEMEEEEEEEEEFEDIEDIEEIEEEEDLDETEYEKE